MSNPSKRLSIDLLTRFYVFMSTQSNEDLLEKDIREKIDPILGNEEKINKLKQDDFKLWMKVMLIKVFEDYNIVTTTNISKKILKKTVYEEKDLKTIVEESAKSYNESNIHDIFNISELHDISEYLKWVAISHDKHVSGMLVQDFNKDSPKQVAKSIDDVIEHLKPVFSDDKKFYETYQNTWLNLKTLLTYNKFKNNLVDKFDKYIQSQKADILTQSLSKQYAYGTPSKYAEILRGNINKADDIAQLLHVNEKYNQFIDIIKNGAYIGIPNIPTYDALYEDRLKVMNKLTAKLDTDPRSGQYFKFKPNKFIIENIKGTGNCFYASVYESNKQYYKTQGVNNEQDFKQYLLKKITKESVKIFNEYDLNKIPEKYRYNTSEISFLSYFYYMLTKNERADEIIIKLISSLEKLSFVIIINEIDYDGTLFGDRFTELIGEPNNRVIVMRILKDSIKPSDEPVPRYRKIHHYPGDKIINFSLYKYKNNTIFENWDALVKTENVGKVIDSMRRPYLPYKIQEDTTMAQRIREEDATARKKQEDADATAAVAATTATLREGAVSPPPLLVEEYSLDENYLKEKLTGGNIEYAKNVYKEIKRDNNFKKELVEGNTYDITYDIYIVFDDGMTLSQAKLASGTPSMDNKKYKLTKNNMLLDMIVEQDTSIEKWSTYDYKYKYITFNNYHIIEQSHDNKPSRIYFITNIKDVLQSGGDQQQSDIYRTKYKKYKKLYNQSNNEEHFNKYNRYKTLYITSKQ